MTLGTNVLAPMCVCVCARARVCVCRVIELLYQLTDLHETSYDLVTTDEMRLLEY
jgi:hypothetical protein